MNGTTYTTSGTYNQLLPNANIYGCDSIITLNITIDAIDNTVSQNNHVLTANETNADYQWIACSDNMPVAGETNQVFTATANGQYAVIVSNGTCADTSACMTVITLQAPENTGPEALQVFLNQLRNDHRTDLIRRYTMLYYG